MTTLREQVAATLAAILPEGKYRIVDSLGALDRLTKPTIQLEQADIERAPAAQGAALVTINVHVITHREGVTAQADDAVDELGVEVFEALASVRYINPQKADKRVYNNSHLEYVIPTQVLTTKRSNP